MRDEQNAQIDELGDRRKTESPNRSHRSLVAGGEWCVAGQEPARVGRNEANSPQDERAFDEIEATILAIKQDSPLMMIERVVAIPMDEQFSPIPKALVRSTSDAKSTKRTHCAPLGRDFEENEATIIGIGQDIPVTINDRVVVICVISRNRQIEPVPRVSSRLGTGRAADDSPPQPPSGRLLLAGDERTVCASARPAAAEPTRALCPVHA